MKSMSVPIGNPKRKFKLVPSPSTIPVTPNPQPVKEPEKVPQRA